MIFIDSDVYLALNLSEDTNNEKAIRLTKQILASHEPKVTSWDVIGEVSTKLRYHFSRTIAEAFIQTMMRSDTTIQFVDESIFRDIVALFLRQSSKNVSMTDCANMVIARKMGITTFFSFDHHYEQNGFRLLK